MSEVDSNNITLEGLSEKELKEIEIIIREFSKSYSKKNKNVTDKEWLKSKLSKELPNLKLGEIENFCDEVFNSIKEFDNNLKSIRESEEVGTSKEVWLANKLQEASSNIPVIQFGEYLSRIDDTIRIANAQMYRAVITTNGNINQCFNLDGFIAEQYHVNTFNMNASLENKPYRAYVSTPESGEAYGKNSIDVFIKDIKKDQILHKYQFKFGKDAKSTINLFNHGKYNNQRFVVPKEQVEEVQSIFNTKSVTSYIGGTEKISTTSNPLTKQEVKKLQNQLQNSNKPITVIWNEFTNKQLAINIGKQASLAGVQAVTIESVFDITYKLVNNEKVEADEVIEKAIISGSDACIKAITAGALKVGAERGILTLIPAGTGGNVFANIACFGIETVKIMSKVTMGECTTAEALNEVGNMATSMFCGISMSLKGAEIGAILGTISFIPFGTFIGAAVGSVVGYMAGGKVGQCIYNGAKKVVNGAKKIVKKTWEGVKGVAGKVYEGAKNIVSGAKSFVSSVTSGIGSFLGI